MMDAGRPGGQVATLERYYDATRATMVQVHHFFSEVPQFGSSRKTCLDPKTDLEKKNPLPDEKSHGLGTQRENHAKTNLHVSDGF